MLDVVVGGQFDVGVGELGLLGRGDLVALCLQRLLDGIEVVNLGGDLVDVVLAGEVLSTSLK